MSRMIWFCWSSMGLPQMCTVASAPKPNQLLVSFALTRSEISSRSPAAAMLDASTVTWPGALPVSGKVLPLSCNSITRLSSVNGTSIGTPSVTLPWSSRGDEIEPRRERAVGLGLARHDAGLGLHAEREDHPVGEDFRLRREGAGRA